MIELTDSRGRKELKIDQFNNDRTEHWNIHLQTMNVPTFFENTAPHSRQLDLMIVEGNDFQITDHPNSFLIPLVLTAKSLVDDKLVYYYQQLHDSEKNGVAIAQISASMTMKDNEDKQIENPQLLMTFSMVKQDSDTMSNNRQDFGGAPRGPSTIVNTDANEIANGGLSVPIEQLDRSVRPDDRVLVVNN